MRMKQGRRRILAGLVAVAMLGGLLPAQAIAQELDSAPCCSLQFMGNGLEECNITYQLGDGNAVDVATLEKDGGGAIWVHEVPNKTIVTLSVQPKEDVNAEYSVNVKEDDEHMAYDFMNVGGVYTFSVNDGREYIVEINREEQHDNDGDDGGNGGNHQEGENVSFEVKNRQNGDVYYKVNDGDKIYLENDCGIVANEGDTITLYAHPNEGQELDTWGTGIWADGQELDADTFDNALLSEAGYSFTYETGKRYDITIEYRGGDNGDDGEGGRTCDWFEHDNYNPDKPVDATFTLKGDADFCINDSETTGLLMNDGESHSIRFNAKDNDNTVDFYFSILFIEQYTSIKINGEECVNQLPTTVEGRLNAFHNQKNIYKLTVPATENNHYAIEVERASEEEIDPDYIVIGNFLWYDKETEYEHGEDDLILGGHMEIKRAEYNGTVLFDDKESINDLDPNGYKDWSYDENIGVGAAVFPEGTVLTVKLIPDYGNQLVSFAINGGEFGVEEDIATYTFKVEKGNFHLGAVFDLVDDDVELSHTTRVREASVMAVEGEETPVEQGTLLATVTDAPESATPEVSEGQTVLTTVDISMQNIFYKGSTVIEDAWKQDVDELNAPVEIALTMDELEKGATYTVIREHEGEDATTLDCEVDFDTKTISFESDRFSTYAIVQHTHSFTNYVANGDATCIKDGTKTATCDGCDETDTVEDTGSAKTAKHKLTEVKAKAATTTATGNNAYYKCSACGKCFKDKEGKTETTAKAETLPKLVKNTITASDKALTVKTTGTQTVNLDAKVKGSAKLTYKSDNKSITVDSKGKVTVKKGYVGKATITITAAATKTYAKTTKTITVTVKKNQSLKVSPLSRTLWVNKKSAQKVKLTVSGNKTKVTYKDNSSKVTVSSKGVVTIAKGFKGKVKVTVTAASSSTYYKATKTVTITVK